MGYGSFSNTAYNTLRSSRLASSGVSAFTYDKDVKSGAVEEKVHERLDPAKIVKFRESRDSIEHPNSNSIVVFFDVTGSMDRIPRTLQEKLPKLMSILLRKNIVDDPQIMFGGIGDAYTDMVPLQVGQFESSEVMDEDIDKIYLEGGGGGQFHESYSLGFYILANKTSIDCLEKRGKRGYAFLIADEQSYDLIKEHVKEIIGDTIEANIPIKTLIQQVQEKYNLFIIIPKQGSCYSNEPRLYSFWKDLLGENVLTLDDNSLVCELIATQIGLCEGSIDNIEDIVKDFDLNPNQKLCLSRAISTTIKQNLPAKTNISGELSVVTNVEDIQLL